MKPGDRVTVVHGLPPDGQQPATIVEMLPHQRARVEFRSGAQLIVQRAILDTGELPTAGRRHRVTDPDTARWAAERTAEQLREHHWLVLAALVSAGARGMIDHEHERVNGLNQDSAGKRRGELCEWGLVENAGTKRPSPRGRPAIVWRATARGVAVYHTYRGAA